MNVWSGYNISNTNAIHFGHIFIYIEQCCLLAKTKLIRSKMSSLSVTRLQPTPVYVEDLNIY